MNRKVKSIASHVLSIYIGLVGANIVWHTHESHYAQKQIGKYGDELQQQWINYTRMESERATNFEVLIPFSALDKPYRPLTIIIDESCYTVNK